MRALDLALKDLAQILRDWHTAVFLVALPILFTLIFGFAFGGFGSTESDPRLPVGVLDEDGGSFLAGRLADLAGGSDVVRSVLLTGLSQEEAADKVQNGELAAAVVIPAGYSDGLFAGETVQVTVITAATSTGGLGAQSEIETLVGHLASAVETARLAAQAYEDQAVLQTGAVPRFSDETREAFLREGVNAALEAWQRPPLTVELTQPATNGPASASLVQSGFSHTSPAMMVQFAIGGLIGVASLLLHERKTRALRRLLTTPIPRWQIILGHYMAMVIVIFLQLILLVAVGLLLRVPYLREPLAILLVIVATAVWTAALGLLIATLARSDDQVVIYSLVPMFVLGGMGGAWVPLEYTGKVFQAIGRLLPTAWAMDGFENIVIRGLGLQSVLLPTAVMLAYAVVLFALAWFRFRYE